MALDSSVQALDLRFWAFRGFLIGFSIDKSDKRFTQLNPRYIILSSELVQQLDQAARAHRKLVNCCQTVTIHQGEWYLFHLVPHGIFINFPMVFPRSFRKAGVFFGLTFRDLSAKRGLPATLKTLALAFEFSSPGGSAPDVEISRVCHEGILYCKGNVRSWCIGKLFSAIVPCFMLRSCLFIQGGRSARSPKMALANWWLAYQRLRESRLPEEH